MANDEENQTISLCNYAFDKIRSLFAVMVAKDIKKAFCIAIIHGIRESVQCTENFA